MYNWEIECPECEKEFEIGSFETVDCCGLHVEWDENEDCDYFPYWGKDIATK